MDFAIAAAIRDVVIEHMGAACAPDGVVSLEELGLEDYPRTPVGKIQKHKVAALIRAYREKHLVKTVSLPHPEKFSVGNGVRQAAEKDILDHLVRIWSQTIGIYDEKRHLPPDTYIKTLPVDSISVMRVRDQVTKALGSNTLTLTELAQGGTIREQAVLLQSRTQTSGFTTAGSPAAEVKKEEETSKAPPEIEDMVHLIEDPSLFDRTKEIVEEAIQACDLSWKDVRTVMPASDFSAVSFRVRSMWHLNLKMVLIAKHKVSKQQLRQCLHRVFLNNLMMASFIVSDAERLDKNLALHVQVQLDEAFLYRYVLADAGSVKTSADIVGFARQQHYPGCTDAVPPGPLSKVWLFDVEDVGSAGFVMNGKSFIVYWKTLRSIG